MNVQSMGVTQEQALACLREYKEHRNVYDKRDWEIELIYRAISKGKTVIGVTDAIIRAGLDEQLRPRLAICPADATTCECRSRYSNVFEFKPMEQKRYGPSKGAFRVRWPEAANPRWWAIQAKLPRIPPQFRPPENLLHRYHVLWEADWTDIPRDPYLLRRIGKDAWVVLAAWELSDVELSVLRAHQRQ